MRLPRFWFRFRLRTLLIVVTIFGLWLGRCVTRARLQAQAVAEIRKQRSSVPDYFSGTVYYDFELSAEDPAEAKSWVPSWLIARAGSDLFHSVVYAQMQQLDGQTFGLDPLKSREPWDKAQVVADVRRHLAALPRLRRLDLSVWPEASEQCLAAVGELANLESLSCTYATDAGIAHLASQRRLKSVTIYDSKLTDESLRVFGTLSRLEQLQATNNHFTDDGLAHLRQLKHLVSLDIDCGETRFTDAGLVHLESLPNLQRLYLQQTLVTPAGIARLQRAIPSLQEVILSPTRDPASPPEPDPFATP